MSEGSTTDTGAAAPAQTNEFGQVRIVSTWNTLAQQQQQPQQQQQQHHAATVAPYAGAPMYVGQPTGGTNDTAYPAQPPQGGGGYAPQGGYQQGTYVNFAQPAQVDANGQPYVMQAIPVSGGGQGRPLSAQAGPVRGMWSDTMCDCFSDCMSCLLGWLFPPYLYARNKSRASLGDFSKTFIMFFIPWAALVALNFMGGYLDYTVLNVILTVAGLVLAFLGAQLRGLIRQKYEIPGHVLEDLFMHCCCTPCAVSQESRHIDRSLGYLV